MRKTLFYTPILGIGLLLSFTACSLKQALDENSGITTMKTTENASSEIQELAVNLPVDFDGEEIIRAYLQKPYTAQRLHTHFEDGYSDQYACREITGDLTADSFSGSYTLMEIELEDDATIGFSVEADIVGNYKVVVLSQQAEILMTTSCYGGQQASRPIDVPKGLLQVVLVGESVSGQLKLAVHPPDTARYEPSEWSQAAALPYEEHVGDVTQ